MSKHMFLFPQKENGELHVFSIISIFGIIDAKEKEWRPLKARQRPRTVREVHQLRQMRP